MSDVFARADRILKQRRERDSVLEAQLGRDLTSNAWIEWTARTLCRQYGLDPDLMLTGIREKPVPQWFIYAPIAKKLLSKIKEKMNGDQ